MMKRTIVLVAIAVLACGKAETPSKPTATSTATSTSPAPAPTNAGDAMPPYTAKLLDGQPFDLAAEKGNVILLNVWATWCGPCRYEIPELQKLHDEYGKRGFKVVGVSVDEGDPAEVKQFAADQKMTYPVVLDPEGRIANLLQTMVLPTTVLIDRSGKIVWRQIGAIPASDAKLTAAIAKALGGVKG
jgi:cytochrome c biogenesis protein CcmG, thiol:disulfide interchange protein DsbE